MSDTEDPARCVVCGVPLHPGDVDWTATCGSKVCINQRIYSIKVQKLKRDTMFNYKVIIVLAILHCVEGVWVLWHTWGAR